MDWKEDIGNFFKEKKIFRLEDQTKQLAEYIKEWKSYIEKFDGIIIKEDIIPATDVKYTPAFVSLEITLHPKTSPFTIAFKIDLGYNNSDTGEIYLFIKYSSGYDANKIRKDNDTFEEEQINDNLIFEKDYILQSLNNIFKKQVDRYFK